VCLICMRFATTSVAKWSCVFVIMFHATWIKIPLPTPASPRQPSIWLCCQLNQVSVASCCARALYAMARWSSVCRSVRLSGSLSPAIFIEKKINLTQWKPHGISVTLVFLVPKILMKFQWGHTQTGVKYSWGRYNSFRFSTNRSMHLGTGTR